MKRKFYQGALRITCYMGLLGFFIITDHAVAGNVDSEHVGEVLTPPGSLVHLASDTKADFINVTGKVTSASDPLGIPGVNIMVKGTTTGTVSDVDGVYSIDVPNDQAVLV